MGPPCVRLEPPVGVNGPTVPAKSAKVADSFGAQGAERAVVVQGQLYGGDLVATVGIGQKAFRAVVDPFFTGTLQLFGGMQNQDRFLIDAVLGAETAAPHRGRCGAGPLF